MRIAYIPMYSSPHNILTCSTYNHVKMFSKAIVEARDDAFLYLTVPENTNDDAAVERDLAHPRIQIVKVPAWRNQHKDLTYLPDKILSSFAEMGGEFFVDAVITDKPAIVPYLKAALQTWGTNGTGGVKVVTVDRFFLRETEHAYAMEDYQRSQIFGLASADLTVFSTKNVLTDALATAKKWLSFSEVKALREKTRFLYSALDTEKLDAFLVDRDENDPTRVVNYAYALSSGYNWKDNLEVFDYLFARGNRDIRVLVTTSSATAGALPERYESYMDVHVGLPQEEFWRKIATAHAFIHLPAYVQLSQSVLEQQYLGLVGVFPDRPWSYDMTYPGYPFIGKGSKELHGMLRYVLDNYFTDEVQEVIKKQRDFIRERFDGKRLSVELYDEIEGLVGVGFPGSQGTLTADMKRMFENVPDGQRIDYDEWAKTIKEQTRMGYDVGNMPHVLHGLSKNRFRKAMIEAGFRDLCDGPMPAFMRETGES